VLEDKANGMHAFYSEEDGSFCNSLPKRPEPGEWSKYDVEPKYDNPQIKIIYEDKRAAA